MLTTVAQGLFTSTGWMIFIGVSLGSLLLNAMARRSGAGRRPRWLRFAAGLLLPILIADLLLLSNLSGQGRVCVVFVTITGTCLLLTKSGRKAVEFIIRSEARPADPVESPTRRLARLTAYIVVTTLVLLLVGIPLSDASIELLEHHAPGWAEALEAPIILAVFLVLMFATLGCLWRWLEGPHARRL